MKKTIALFMLMTISLVAMAQGHLTFQGIPIDGSIASFEQKLKAKGWVYDDVATTKERIVTRIYNGVFGGMKGQLWVKWTPKSKVVYTVAFFGERTFTKSIAFSEKDKHISSIRSKFPKAYQWKNEEGDTQFDLDNGMIICKVIEEDQGGMFSSMLTYYDDINYQKFLSEKTSDY